MPLESVRLRKAENGYVVTVCGSDANNKSRRGDAPMAYKEKDHVAPSEGHALKIVAKALHGERKTIEKPKGKKRAVKR